MPRKHLDNLESTFTSASSGATSVTITPAPADLAAGEYFWATFVDDIDMPTVRDTVKVTAAVSGALTFEPALANDYASGGVVMASNPGVLFDEVDGALLLSYREKTGTASSGAITMADGPVQGLTLAANTTLSFSDMQDGQNVTLHVFGLNSGWTLAFPVGAKTSTFPDLSTAVEAVFTVWKKGTQIYAVFVEEFS